jgi:DinB superfamily
MPLTAQQREDLIRRYAEGPAKLAAAIAQVPAEARKWRPGPGKWSAHEVVCHCADSETNAAVRIRFLMAEPDAKLLGYDQDRWAKVFDYHSMPWEPSLAVVQAVRAVTTLLLRRAPEEAWSRTGTHTESGSYSAERWLEVYAEHLEKHSRQIERNLQAWRAEATKPR